MSKVPQKGEIWVSEFGEFAYIIKNIDSKSCFLWKYEFKSHHPYHFEKAGFYPVFFVAGKHSHSDFTCKSRSNRFKYLPSAVRMKFGTLYPILLHHFHS